MILKIRLKKLYLNKKNYTSEIKENFSGFEVLETLYKKTSDLLIFKIKNNKILPKNLKLRTIEVVNSGLEIFTKIEDNENQYLFIIADEKNTIEIKNLSNGKTDKYSGDREDFDVIDFGATKLIFVKHKILFIKYQ